MKGQEGGRETGRVRGRREEGQLHMKAISETNIFFFFTAQSIYFLVKSNVWVHLAMADLFDLGQLENRQCESVTQKRSSENIFHWLHSGKQEKESSIQPKCSTLPKEKRWGGVGEEASTSNLLRLSPVLSS